MPPATSSKYWALSSNPNIEAVPHVCAGGGPRLTPAPDATDARITQLAPPGGNLYNSMVTFLSYKAPGGRLMALGLWLFIVALAGCGKGDIQIYRVARAEAGGAGTAVAADPALPAGWQQLPPDQMRVGNYAIAGDKGARASVTVIPLPAGSGNELDNVNRWRGQVGPAPLTAPELQAPDQAPPPAP